TAALIILAIVVAVQQIESDLISPLVFARAVRLHPVVILVALTGGAVIAGVVGAFLSVPLVAILAASGNELKKIKGYDEESEKAVADRPGENGNGEPGEGSEAGEEVEKGDDQ
ncbi:MAG TPA: AI-2E family transporter, partial [Actinomycetota bacterium]|nr:AI-2E family transporter [Actinomycetota bacterium]